MVPDTELDATETTSNQFASEGAVRPAFPRFAGRS